MTLANVIYAQVVCTISSLKESSIPSLCFLPINRNADMTGEAESANLAHKMEATY